MSTFRRLVEFMPGYNYLHETGPQRRGQHGMAVKFVLVGPLGATQFAFNTMWTPLGVVDEESRRKELVHIDSDYWHVDQWGTFGTVRPPTGTDLGYHWRTPQWEGQEDYRRDSCQYLGGTCYYDGSGMRAGPVLQEFITKGESAVWRTLIEEYRHLAGPKDES